MEIRFNLTGEQRKKLVTAISEITNQPQSYKGAPTFNYEVGNYTISKDGTVTSVDSINSESNSNLLKALNVLGYIGEVAVRGDDGEPQSGDVPENGFIPCPNDGFNASATDGWYAPGYVSRTYQAELSDPNYPDRMEVFSAENDADAIRQAYEFATGEIVLLELFELDENYNLIRGIDLTSTNPNKLTIEIPLDGFAPEKLDNLNKLVESKASLLKAALATDSLKIIQTADTLQFPWFWEEHILTSDEIEAFSTLISLLCKTALKKKRITAKEKGTESNLKYAMRCFLLSLGFIGDEYKTARKILLSRLEGNISWKNGKKAISDDTISE